MLLHCLFGTYIGLVGVLERFVGATVGFITIATCVNWVVQRVQVGLKHRVVVDVTHARVMSVHSVCQVVSKSALGGATRSVQERASSLIACSLDASTSN